MRWPFATDAPLAQLIGCRFPSSCQNLCAEFGADGGVDSGNIRGVSRFAALLAK
jgi:hypothetical protein